MRTRPEPQDDAINERDQSPIDSPEATPKLELLQAPGDAVLDEEAELTEATRE